MPTTLNETQINTLKQFSSYIEGRVPKSLDQTLWFRGAGKSNYGLIPTLFRHATITIPDKIIEVEIRVMDRFNQRSVPFLSHAIDTKNEWEVLFFMQHYGIPTRLLDWSENPFIALYFALTSAPYSINNRKRVYDQDAAIWVLDPVAWNRESLKDFSYNHGILSVEDDLIGSYKPRTLYGNMREKPVAIYGIHNSSRIVAQRGVFIVFGKSVTPMEETYIDHSFPQDCLTKLILPKNHISDLMNSLNAIGITDSVVYPDLEGLAKEIRRFFKFDI